VENEKRFIECDDSSVHALQGMYNTHAVMLKQLEMSTELSARDLQSMSGLDQKEFSRVVNQLVKYGFVRYGTKVVPTQRFRIAMSRIDEEVYMPKVGEE
jgi:DNA-binding MarR family transcriptional regulator